MMSPFQFGSPIKLAIDITHKALTDSIKKSRDAATKRSKKQESNDFKAEMEKIRKATE